MAKSISDGQGTTPASVFSIPDGDLILQSSDGVELRVDAVVLRRASSVFETMFAVSSHAPDTKPASLEPITLPESASVLSDVLRSLYPSIEEPTFHFPSASHSVAVLQALDKYEISSWALKKSAGVEISAADPPVRAWALAVQADHESARATAVRRFISQYSEKIDYDMPELASVDARSLLHLLRIAQEVQPEARDAVNAIIRASFAMHSEHDNFDALQEARKHPFDKSLLDEEVIGARATGFQNANCPQCRAHFSDAVNKTQREFGRHQIDEIMERAVARERAGPVSSRNTNE